MNPTPYRARHLGDHYSIAQVRAERVASYYAVHSDPMHTRGRHAAYDRFIPTQPETREPVESVERAA